MTKIKIQGKEIDVSLISKIEITSDYPAENIIEALIGAHFRMTITMQVLHYEGIDIHSEDITLSTKSSTEYENWIKLIYEGRGRMLKNKKRIK